MEPILDLKTFSHLITISSEKKHQKTFFWLELFWYCNKIIWISSFCFRNLWKWRIQAVVVSCWLFNNVVLLLRLYSENDTDDEWMKWEISESLLSVNWAHISCTTWNNWVEVEQFWSLHYRHKSVCRPWFYIPLKVKNNTFIFFCITVFGTV
jgi:hypothetical protein